MRVILVTLAVLAATAAVSVEAGQKNAAWVDLGAAPPRDLVAQRCAHNWLSARWRDHWGYWHEGHCIPQGEKRSGAPKVGDPSQGWVALDDQTPGPAALPPTPRAPKSRTLAVLPIIGGAASFSQ
jgi:hypothetical protein